VSGGHNAVVRPSADRQATAPPALRGRLRASLGPERARALRHVLALFATFQVTVWTIAAIASLKLPPHPPLNDPDLLTRPLGPLGNAIVAPLARYDAAWYLGVAAHGYGPAHEGLTRFMGFFPLYPLLVRAVAATVTYPFGTRVSYVLAGSLVSAAALVPALYLLHRLAELDLGPRLARATVALTLAFPTAFFFAAPYTESLFLLLSVGAIYAARLGRWPLAGLAAALASATRPGGVLVLVPLVMLYLWGPRSDRPPRPRASPAARPLPAHRPSWDVLWLGLAPAGALAFFAFLRARYGHFDAYLTVQRRWWHHHVAGPGSAVARLADDARTAFGQIRDGAPVAATRAPIDAMLRPAFVILGLLGVVGIARRIQPAYAAYALVSLALPLLSPPSIGVARYLVVVFPLFMWLAVVADRRGVLQYVLAFSVALLALFTAAFATWRGVA
jgi:hypothetical protein